MSSESVSPLAPFVVQNRHTASTSRYPARHPCRITAAPTAAADAIPIPARASLQPSTHSGTCHAQMTSSTARLQRALSLAAHLRCRSGWRHVGARHRADGACAHHSARLGWASCGHAYRGTAAQACMGCIRCADAAWCGRVSPAHSIVCVRAHVRLRACVHARAECAAVRQAVYVGAHVAVCLLV